MSAEKAVVIIPARLAATRLPNKPLLDIAGKPMIQHVYERSCQARNIADVLVATPDREIISVVTGFGGKAVLTSPEHRTGTDRLAEAARTLPEDISIVVNVQGDEPRIDPATISLVAGLVSGDTSMASVMCPLPSGRESDPNVVKVVCDRFGYALYFSRSPLPYRRSMNAPCQPMQHIGLYAYRRNFLLRFPNLPPTPLEQAEALEQLRALEHGYRIRMARTEQIPESVDTPEDLERVRALFADDARSIR